MNFQEIKITLLPLLTLRSVANYSVPDEAILRNFHTEGYSNEYTAG